jgi:hypothetical protein
MTAGVVYQRAGRGQYRGAGVVGQRMTIIRIVLVLTVAACGGGASTSTKSARGALHNVDDANGCRPAYTEYERRWRIARTLELAGIPGAPSPEVIEDIVSNEVETLPDRDELAKLREIHALVETQTPDTPWEAAFAAAERAVAVCGEKPAVRRRELTRGQLQHLAVVAPPAWRTCPAQAVLKDAQAGAIPDQDLAELARLIDEQEQLAAEWSSNDGGSHPGGSRPGGSRPRLMRARSLRGGSCPGGSCPRLMRARSIRGSRG